MEEMRRYRANGGASKRHTLESLITHWAHLFADIGQRQADSYKVVDQLEAARLQTQELGKLQFV